MGSYNWEVNGSQVSCDICYLQLELSVWGSALSVVSGWHGPGGGWVRLPPMRSPGPYLAAQDFLRAAGPCPTYGSSVGSSQTSRQSSTALCPFVLSEVFHECFKWYSQKLWQWKYKYGALLRHHCVWHMSTCHGKTSKTVRKSTKMSTVVDAGWAPFVLLCIFYHKHLLQGQKYSDYFLKNSNTLTMCKTYFSASWGPDNCTRLAMSCNDSVKKVWNSEVN